MDRCSSLVEGPVWVIAKPFRVKYNFLKIMICVHNHMEFYAYFPKYYLFVIINKIFFIFYIAKLKNAESDIYACNSVSKKININLNEYYL